MDYEFDIHIPSLENSRLNRKEILTKDGNMYYDLQYDILKIENPKRDDYTSTMNHKLYSLTREIMKKKKDREDHLLSFDDFYDYNNDKLYDVYNEYEDLECGFEEFCFWVWKNNPRVEKYYTTLKFYEKNFVCDSEEYNDYC